MLKVVSLPPEAELLPDGSKPGGWWRELPDGRLLCELCPRACRLHEGDRGFCFVRQNIGGQIVLTTYGRSTGFCIDPIEKKPLNHFYPGTSVLSFGTAGCNLGCKFCQNWDISKSREVERLSETAMPDAIVAAAKKYQCRSVAFTYNDPVIWAEYAIDTAKLCRQEGIKTVAVTAGYITAAARGPFYEFMDAANVDLKGFTEDFYQYYTLSHLQPVLDTLEWLKKETQVWFEITNLVIPRANDDPDEIRRLCQWVLQHVGDDVPVHFTAFHPDFRLRDRPPTSKETLLMAYDIAVQEGLKYVYVGNVDDWDHQSTYCHQCRRKIIARNWYEIGEYHLKGDRCAFCDAQIPGRFDQEPGDWGRRRLPVRIADFRVPPLVTLESGQGASGRAARSNTADPAARASAERRPNSVGKQAPTTRALSQGGSSISRAASSSLQTIASSSQTASSPQTTASLLQTTQAVPKATSSFVKARSLASDPLGSGTETMSVSANTMELTQDQRRAVLQAACQVVAAEIAGRQVAWPDPTLSGAANLRVEGVFVTLKRQGRLRACCGSLGNSLPLAQALRHAASRAATDDIRLPMIGMSELPYLTVDVTLLHSFRKLPSDANERLKSVVVGQHGLQIRLGDHAGLLLPQVATEHGWSSEEFLQHVALKAGLASDAWQDPRAELQTFEGYTVSGPFDGAAATFFASMAPYGFTLQQLQEMAEAVRYNVLAAWTGATPTYYLPQVPDRTVHGVAIQVQADSDEGEWMAQLSTRPGVPLQATLFQLASDVAKTVLPQKTQVPNVRRVDVAILEDLQTHGTLEEPDLRGFDAARRLLLMSSGRRYVGAYQPAHSVTAILDALSEQAAAWDPAATMLWSFQVATTAPHVWLSSAGKARPEAAPRPAAVAGSFYPAEPQRLQRLLEQLSPATAVPASTWPAAMVPHAGLIYSGRIAAQVWQRLEIPDTVIILCPKHTPWGSSYAVAPHTQWLIPGSSVAGNLELARRLAESVPGWQLDARAHQQEHAIEVELPFVHRFAPHARVVGVALGPCGYEQAAAFGRALAEVVRACDPRPVLVISSDMNHYAEDAENRRRDRLALQAMATLNPRHLYDTVRQHDISMCGIIPAVVVMEALRHLGQLTHFEEVAYGTSGDVSGDRSRVVGYAGVLLG
jgi:AmmeMemoRadiSam system radical SAM enzyme/AmmeMemoRadiSam system protein B/AmmeMemoRadiSam system protein A